MAFYHRINIVTLRVHSFVAFSINDRVEKDDMGGACNPNEGEEKRAVYW
jgi:hypothetical protein